MTDQLIDQIVTVITLMSYTATCLRLMAYQRGLSNYKWTVSFIAWCLIVFTGTGTLEILFHPTKIYLGTAGIAVTLLVLVWRARGNVANILRSYS
jgi:hypothetical protein